MRLLLVSLLILAAGCSTSGIKRSGASRKPASLEFAQPDTPPLESGSEEEEESSIDDAFADIPPPSSGPKSDDKVVLSWPIGSRKITGQFGEKRRRHFHTGLDISAPKGTPVFAPADGKILSIKPRRGYGKTVMITHDEDWDFVTIFGHLSRILVRAGESIRRGQVIGLVGRTGHASGPHLHFEVRVYTKAVDPQQYLP